LQLEARTLIEHQVIPALERADHRACTGAGRSANGGITPAPRRSNRGSGATYDRRADYRIAAPVAGSFDLALAIGASPYVVLPDDAGHCRYDRLLPSTGFDFLEAQQHTVALDVADAAFEPASAGNYAPVGHRNRLQRASFELPPTLDLKGIELGPQFHQEPRPRRDERQSLR